MSDTNAEALRALEEIRDLRQSTEKREVSLQAALGGITTKLAHIENMVSGQTERHTAQDRRIEALERKVEQQTAEVATLKLEVAKAQAAGAPLQRLAYAVITLIVIGFGSALWLSANRTAAPPNITIQMPASHP